MGLLKVFPLLFHFQHVLAVGLAPSAQIHISKESIPKPTRGGNKQALGVITQLHRHEQDFTSEFLPLPISGEGRKLI